MNTLFQEMMDHHNQKDGSRETPKLDPCWKSRPVACLVNMESRLEFGLWAETKTHSWVRISHGPKKLWWIWTTTTQKFLKISLKNKRCNWRWRILHADQRQTTKKEFAGYSPRIIPMNTRNWIDTEPVKHSLSAYELSKKVIHLHRYSQQVQREEDGSIEFWRIKDFRNDFVHSSHWEKNWDRCWTRRMFNAKYHTDARKKMDRHWAIRTNSRCVRSLEESDQSSSTQWNSTAGRRWSNSILEN